MLNLVVAWMAEARPLIDHFQLRPLSRKFGFRIYRRDEIALVVSGQGVAAAAAGTAWLQSALGGDGATWLNVGIGGHRRLEIGHPVVARRVYGEHGGRHWRMRALPPDLTAADVCTVDRPDGDYRRDAVVEMEAAGFVATASRFTEAERIGCLKIVSDNARHPHDKIEPGRVSQLVAANLDALERLAAAAGGFDAG